MNKKQLENISDYVCILSGQDIPNIRMLPLLTNLKVVHLILTAKMSEKKQKITHFKECVSKIFHKKMKVEIIRMESDFHTRLTEILSPLNNFIFCGNGGQKDTFFTLLEVLESLNYQDKLFLVNDNNYVFLYNNDYDTIPYFNHMEPLLYIYNYEVCNQHLSTKIDETNLCFAKDLEKEQLPYKLSQEKEKSLSNFYNLMEISKNHRKPIIIPRSKITGNTQKLVDLFSKYNFLKIVKKNIEISYEEYEDGFVQGKWFESFVFYLLEKRLKQGELQEDFKIYHSVETKQLHQPDNTKREHDIVVLYRDKIFLIEVKTSKNKEQGANEIEQKLSSKQSAINSQNLQIGIVSLFDMPLKGDNNTLEILENTTSDNFLDDIVAKIKKMDK